jgi:REP element-mobilizing transposase RayT
MGQSLSNILIHGVFSTKNRAPWISCGIRPKLHAYLGGLLRNQGCCPLEIGGVEDHVHVLFILARTVTVADGISILKANSSRWLKSQGHDLEPFQWQSGYGAFSVDSSQVEVVRRYIREQESHHRQACFQEEYRSFLREHGIQFDEKYVWD